MSKTNYSFSSSRLQFSLATWKDLPQIHILACDEAVQRYNTLGVPDSMETTRKNYRAFIDADQNTRRTLFCWLIRRRDDQGFIGVCGLTLSAERFQMGEIFYNLMPDFWGQGFGTETAQAMISFCFNDLKLHRVEAGVAVNNERSIRLLEKVGMTREGLHRKILPIRGEWVDNYEYAILDFDPRDYSI